MKINIKIKSYQNLSEEEKWKRQKNPQDRYQTFSEEEKVKKCQHHRDRNKNLSEAKKRKKLSIWEIII